MNNNPAIQNGKSSVRAKFIAIVGLFLSVVLLIFCVRAYFHLPQPEDSISQDRYKNILEAYRMHLFVATPLLSVWLIYVSIVMWTFSKKFNSNGEANS
jgi:ABC-type sulfate transport system permease component